MKTISNFSKWSGTERHFTNADKGEEKLYVRNSFPVWKKPAACEPVRHLKELFITALTRANAAFISRETSQTPNVQKTGFGSPLQAFVCISIWKVSILSCVSTEFISCLNRSRLGICSEVFIIRLGAKIYPSSGNQTNTAYCPQTSKLCFIILNVSWKIWALQVW